MDTRRKVFRLHNGENPRIWLKEISADGTRWVGTPHEEEAKTFSSVEQAFDFRSKYNLQKTLWLHFYVKKIKI